MSEIPGPEVSYVTLLNVKTQEASEKEEQEIAEGAVPAYNPLRPSSAGRCTRELAYALMEYTKQAYYPKEVREPNVTRLLSLGHYLEPHVMEQFKKYTAEFFQIKYDQHSVEAFEIETTKYPDIGGIIEGSLDWCFWNPESKGLIDLKTKKDKFSRFYKTKWEEDDAKFLSMKSVVSIDGSDKGFYVEDPEAFIDELNDPFLAMNIWQTNLYANTDWAKRKGINHVSLLYYNKNDSRLRELRFKPSRALYERAHKKFQTAATAADKGKPELAPRDFVLGNIKCAFCPYAKACWKNKDAKQAFFDTFPKKKWPKDASRLKKELSTSFEDLYSIYKEELTSKDNLDRVESDILKLMADNEISKIKFSDGHVYERKLYKSPRLHYKLKRTKL